MLTVPLTVRLSTARGDKHVTRRLHDLAFDAVVPGGYGSATLSFDQPLALTDPAVGIYGKVYIYDGRTGATVFEGRQEDPGRGSSDSGQVWTLNAFGGSVHALDRSDATVCYVENGVESFAQIRTLGLQTGQINTTDDDTPQIKVAIPNGAVLGATARLPAVTKIVADCGSNLARFKATWDAGITDAAFQVQLRSMPSVAGTKTVVASSGMSTSGGTMTGVITTDIPVGDDICDFSLTLTGSARTNGDDQHWASASVIIQGTRYTRAGVELTAGANYTTDTVLASQVVADLLGRWLNQYDGTNASIDTTAYTIDRLVYPDPTTPSQILDDLMALESGYFWAAWESTAAGGYRFVWQAWPTTVRYECSIDDDFDSPGDVGDLYNAVLVRYRDTNGRPRSVRVTQAQTDLDNAGITRCASIDLGDNVGSKANAQQAGTRFLLDHNSPPNQGSLNISAPIMDLVSGRMVAPWELQPGNLIRVRGVLPRVDALNATDRDAVTVFRMVGTSYTASTNTCQVSLDSLGRGTADQITSAHKRISKLRKR